VRHHLIVVSGSQKKSHWVGSSGYVRLVPKQGGKICVTLVHEHAQLQIYRMPPLGDSQQQRGEGRLAGFLAPGPGHRGETAGLLTGPTLPVREGSGEGEGEGSGHLPGGGSRMTKWGREIYFAPCQRGKEWGSPMGEHSGEKSSRRCSRPAGFGT